MYTNCLRPIFTEHIFKRLKDGESINVYGSVDVNKYGCNGIGVGKTRLIEDIVSIASTDEKTNALVISLNMNKYRYGEAYDLFLSDLSEYFSNNISFTNFTDFLEISSKQKIYLLLDNFHYFFDNDKKDSRFNSHFIDNLNAAHNKNISILITTQKPHMQYQICVEGSSECRASWLEFIDISITDLTHQELVDEAKRVFPSFDNNQIISFVGYLKTNLSISIINEFKQYLESNSPSREIFSQLKICIENVKLNCKKQYKKDGNKIRDWFDVIKEIRSFLKS